MTNKTAVSKTLGIAWRVGNFGKNVFYSPSESNLKVSLFTFEIGSFRDVLLPNGGGEQNFLVYKPAFFKLVKLLWLWLKTDFHKLTRCLEKILPAVPCFNGSPNFYINVYRHKHD